MSYLEKNSKYLQYLKKSEGILPRFLNLELTSHCNLRCIMCPKTVGFHTHKPDNEISEVVLDKIIRQVLPSVYHINLMGFGEPLIAEKKLLILLNECKRLHITVNMITNGQLLGPDIVKTLVELNIFNINVSLDAASAETYKKIRNSDFDRVIRNLQSLKKIKDEKKSAFPTLDLSFVGMIDNITELPDFIKIAHDVGARKVVLQALSEVPDTLVHQKDIFIHNRDIGLDNYNKALEVARDLGIEIELFPADQFETKRDDNPAEHKIPNVDGVQMVKDCIEPWNAVFISSEGGVSPCCGLSSMGDLNSVDFTEIWFGKEMTELRENLRTDRIPQNCIYCRGAGWKKPTEIREELIIGKDDSQLGSDWYTLDRDCIVMTRWSGQTGTYFIKRSVDPSEIEIESIVSGAFLTVKIDDKSLFTSKMSGDSLSDRFLLEPTKSPRIEKADELIKVTLQTSKTLKPAEKNGNDGRSLGLKFFSHSKLCTVGFAGGWELIVGMSKMHNHFSNKDGWVSIDAIVSIKNQNAISDLPFLFIHIVKKGVFFDRFFNRLFPDGFLRIIHRLYSGSFKINSVQKSENGSKLEQFKLSWDQKLHRGSYDVYSGLWFPKTRMRIPIIKKEKSFISKNRILLDTFKIK